MSSGSLTEASPGATVPHPGVLVDCAGVSRRFGSGAGVVRAVREVSCRVGVGARVAVVGPSGSGKSTLVHLLAGLEVPTTGVVSWPGLSVGADGRPGRVGVVFQGPSLIESLDVIENVALPLLIAGTREDQAAGSACAALDRLGLGGLGAKLPEELSGGQAQRVAVARVLAGRPGLILADEPTGQLDRHSGERVVSVLLAAADELDAALVVCTHDPAVADRLPNCWRMVDGHLTGQDTSC